MNTIKGRLFQFQHGCFEEISMVSRVFFALGGEREGGGFW